MVGELGGMESELSDCRLPSFYDNLFGISDNLTDPTDRQEKHPEE
jgi:hypothetical protein